MNSMRLLAFIRRMYICTTIHEKNLFVTVAYKHPSRGSAGSRAASRWAAPLGHHVYNADKEDHGKNGRQNDDSHLVIVLSLGVVVTIVCMVRHRSGVSRSLCVQRLPLCLQANIRMGGEGGKGRRVTSQYFLLLKKGRKTTHWGCGGKNFSKVLPGR